MTNSILSDILILATVCGFLAHLWSNAKSGRFFMFDPLMFFWVGVIVIYVIDPISHYADYVSYFGESAVQKALFWIVVGMVFLHLGYGLTLGDRLAAKMPAPPSQLRPGRVLFFCFILIILGLIGWWMQIMTAGSFASWAAVSRGGEDWEKVSGYVTAMASLLTVGVTLLVLHVELYRRGILLRAIAWLMLVLLFIFFLYLGTRSRTIGIIVIAFMAWSIPRRRSPGLMFVVAFFIGLLLITSFQAEYRGHFRNLSFNLDEIDWNEVPAQVLPKFITGSSSTKVASIGSEFGMTTAVVDMVPDRIPYALGYEFLQIFTHAIPREVWPEKPYPKNEIWTEVHLAAGSSLHWVDHVKTPFLAGPSPSYIGSWYYNGGVFGLVIGGLITGVFLRLIRGVYDRSLTNEGFVFLYMVLGPVGFVEVVGHPLSWVYSLPPILLPLWIFLQIARRRDNRYPSPTQLKS